MRRHPVYASNLYILICCSARHANALTCAISTLTRWRRVCTSARSPLSRPPAALLSFRFFFNILVCSVSEWAAVSFWLPVRVSRSLQSLVEAAAATHTHTLSLCCSLARALSRSLAHPRTLAEPFIGAANLVALFSINKIARVANQKIAKNSQKYMN